MKLIVGLGNPGRAYVATRHNVGFMMIQLLAKDLCVHLKRDTKLLCLKAQGVWETEEFILAEPMTFMNLSGEAVRLLMRHYGLGEENLLVVCDDINLTLGRLRLRAKGSCGGHRGLRSVIENLASKEFARLRLGIGSVQDTDLASYVLSNFSLSERLVVREMLSRAMVCSKAWLREGIDKAMSAIRPATQS